MLVSDFCRAAIDEIQYLETSSARAHYLIELESYQFYCCLKNYLAAHLNNKETFSTVYVNRLLNILSTRWQLINHTDASYVHATYSLGNRCALALAERISHWLEEESEKPRDSTLYFLIPTVPLWELNRKKVAEYKLHEIVLSDDNIPIDVQKCLDDAAQHKSKRLYLTGMTKRELNEEERKRVIYHSSETEMYYEAINFFIESTIPNDMRAGREMLVTALNDDHYQVNSSYGEAGRKHLVKAILSQVKQPHDFIVLMQRVPYESWKEFITLVEDEDLNRLFAPHKLFSENVNAKLYTKDEQQNRAVFFILAEIYFRHRSAEKKFTSQLGYLTAKTQKYFGSYSLYIRSYDKAEKIAAVLALQDFLASNRPLAEMDHFFQLPENQKVAGPLFESNSELGGLTQQIRNKMSVQTTRVLQSTHH